MSKVWVEKSADSQKVRALQEALGMKSDIVPRLLVQRGIEDFDTAKKFFRPSLDHLYNPFLMKDMDKAVKRIEEALQSNERILIFGDYDVDGTTAVSLVYSFFSSFYDKLDYYVPNRYAEGYGVSIKGIDWAKERGVTLIIALDCGIKAIDKVSYAKELGIDFIICDHHRPGSELPDALAVLDPKRDDCNYPFKELSGAAIGFKLCQAFAKERKHISDESLFTLLDLVAVSIAADIVPIEDENRTLAFFGLRQLSQAPRPGLSSLIELSGLKPPITISDIVFKIGPRINAAGRMQDGKEAVRLLIGEAMGYTLKQAEVLQQHNDDRRQLDRDTTSAALAMISEDRELQYSSVVFSPDWHKGVIGIVASRLIEHFYRPTIVLTAHEGKVSGSARSVKGFDIYQAIEACSDLLEQFGGHTYAAGLTMPEENFPQFKMQFESVVRERITEEMMIPQIEYDDDIPLWAINHQVYKLLSQFEPFGPGNPRPVFVSRNVYLALEPRVVGEEHLKLVFRQEGITVDAIGFGLGHLAEKLDNRPLDVIFSLQENVWRGKSTIQMNLKDLKFAEI
jgi:single-stranded-DNA-specific exonuclease